LYRSGREQGHGCQKNETLLSGQGDLAGRKGTGLPEESDLAYKACSVNKHWSARNQNLTTIRSSATYSPHSQQQQISLI